MSLNLESRPVLKALTTFERSPKCWDSQPISSIFLVLILLKACQFSVCSTLCESAKCIGGCHFILTFNLHNDFISTFHSKCHNAKNACAINKIGGNSIRHFGQPHDAAGFFGATREERGWSSVQSHWGCHSGAKFFHGRPISFGWRDRITG